MEAKVLSLHVGRAKTYGKADTQNFLEKQWYTASFKEACDTPLFVSFEGFLGDEVADTLHHGGVDKAVFANSYENYAHWAKFLGLDTLPLGALAENLTLSELHESNVMLGDIHQIGSTILQVLQPRKPCWKISRRWNHQAFTSEIFTSGLSGWYYKVLKEGEIQKGDTIKCERGEGAAISILQANEAFREPTTHNVVLEMILKVPHLATNYYESVEKRLFGQSDLRYMETR